MSTTLADINNILEKVATNTEKTSKAVGKLARDNPLDKLEKEREKKKEGGIFKGLTGIFSKSKGGKSKSSYLPEFLTGFSAGQFAGILGKSMLRALPGILVATMADEIVDTLLDGDQLTADAREKLIKALEFGGIGLIFGKKFAVIGAAIGALTKELEDPKYDPALQDISDSFNSIKVALFGESNVGPGGMYSTDGLLSGTLPALMQGIADGMRGIAQIITGQFINDDWWEQLKKGNFDNIFSDDFEDTWLQAMGVIGGLAILMGPKGAFLKSLKFLVGFGLKNPVGRILLAAAAGGAAASALFDSIVNATVSDPEEAKKIIDEYDTAVQVGGAAATAYGAKKLLPGKQLADAAADGAKRLPPGVTQKMADVANGMGLKFNSAGQLVDKNTGQYIKKEVAEKFAKKAGSRLATAAIPFVGWMIAAGMTLYDIYEFTEGRGVFYDVWKYLNNTPGTEEIMNDIIKSSGNLADPNQKRFTSNNINNLLNHLEALRKTNPEAFSAMYEGVKNQFYGKGITDFDARFDRLNTPQVYDTSTYDDEALRRGRKETPAVSVVSNSGNTHIANQTQALALSDFGTGDRWNTNRRGMHSTSPAYP